MNALHLPASLPSLPSEAERPGGASYPVAAGALLASQLRRLVHINRAWGSRHRSGSPGGARPYPAASDLWPRHHTIIGVDIVGFGRREEYVQNYVREAMYFILGQAFVESGVSWPPPGCIEDRGDGALITMSPDIPTQRAIDPLVHYLTAGLRRHNKVSSESAQIMLRMAVHAGLVRRDDHGLTGDAIVRLFRLLDAPAFKEEVASRRPTLAIVVSQDIYETVICSGLGLIDPDDYRRLAVVNKETVADAWVHLRQRP